MKMKRTLSLVLALVMVLGTFGTVFAETVVETPETNVDAGALLKDLGVLVGNAEGDLMLEEGLKRQDAVILLAKLMGEFDVAKDFPTVEGEVPTYEDIEDNFYLPFLAWAQANETFVGHTPANFGFNEEMTVQQYAKVLLTVLGHEVGPDADVKWEDVMDTAKDLGLVDTTEEVGFTRGVMAMMTYNALNTKMKDSDQTLAEFLDIEMPEVEEEEAKELKIEKVYSENLAEVVVELSNAKLVENMEALTNKNNYRINGVTVHNVDVVGNDLVLTLVPYGEVEDAKVLTKGKDYDLVIRNVKGINSTTEFEAKDVAVPTVENVEFLGAYGIKVTTSEPVRNPQESNFRLDDKATRVLIEQYGRELILTPYYSNDKFDLDAEKLVINNLVDFAGYRAASVFEDIQELEDDAAPVVEKAYRNGKTLKLVFDRDIYKDSVVKYLNRRSEGNVSFVERRTEFFADVSATKTDTNVAVYEFEREIPRDAVVTVVGVQNHNKKAMDKQEIETMLFEDDYAPVVVSDLSTTVRAKDQRTAGKVAPATTGLKVEFDKDIRELVDILELADVKVAKDNVKNATAANKEAMEKALVELLNKKINLDNFFKVYNLEVSYLGEVREDHEIHVEAIEKDSITISFEGLRVNERRLYDYILEVRDFNDDNGRNRMEREYIDFYILPEVDSFNVLSVKTHATRAEIDVKFNEQVDRASAGVASNYEIDGELFDGDAIVSRDLKTVTLVFDMTRAEFDAENYKVLDVTARVRNAAKRASVQDNKWNIDGDAVVAPTPVDPVEAITYIDANEKDIKDSPLVLIQGENGKVTVKLTGKKDETAQAKLLDKNGDIEDNQVIDIKADQQVDSTEVYEGTEDIEVPVTKSATYTIKVTQAGKVVSTLDVKVVSNKVSTGIQYKDDAETYITLNTSGIIDFHLPEDVEIADVKLKDLKYDEGWAEKNNQEVEIKEALDAELYDFMVIVTAENGNIVTYRIKLVEAQ